MNTQFLISTILNLCSPIRILGCLWLSSPLWLPIAFASFAWGAKSIRFKWSVWLAAVEVFAFLSLALPTPWEMVFARLISR